MLRHAFQYISSAMVHWRQLTGKILGTDTLKPLEQTHIGKKAA